MQLTMQVIWTNQFTWYFGSSPQCGFHIPFRCSLEVNFTVEGWGMVFPCYGRQASDFFKACKPLCLTVLHRSLLLDPIPPPPPLSLLAPPVSEEKTSLRHFCWVATQVSCRGLWLQLQETEQRWEAFCSIRANARIFLAGQAFQREGRQKRSHGGWTEQGNCVFSGHPLLWTHILWSPFQGCCGGWAETALYQCDEWHEGKVPRWWNELSTKERSYWSHRWNPKSSRKVQSSSAWTWCWQQKFCANI